MNVSRCVLDQNQAQAQPEMVHWLKADYPTLQILDLGENSGDLLVQLGDKTVIVEFKEMPNDFVASVQDRRIFRQCEGIRATTPWAFLVLSSDPTYDSQYRLLGRGPSGYGPIGQWTRDHVDGVLTSIMARGVIVRTAYQGYRRLLQRILDWTVTADRGTATFELPKLSPFNAAEQATVNWLCHFEGIGVQKAKWFIEWAGARPIYKLLLLATQPFNKDKPHGWSNATIHSNRSQWGLTDSIVLTETYREPYKEEL